MLQDIGGGWQLEPGEEVTLAHAPLVWMVREARKAGLRFDEEKMIDMKCWDAEKPWIDNDFASAQEEPLAPDADVPRLQVSGVPESPSASKAVGENGFPLPSHDTKPTKFQQMLLDMASKSVKHDCLEFGGGLKATQVLSWGFMEYLPFRRMDLL
jgi:hypothetical protein